MNNLPEIETLHKSFTEMFLKPYADFKERDNTTDVQVQVVTKLLAELFIVYSKINKFHHLTFTDSMSNCGNCIHRLVIKAEMTCTLHSNKPVRSSDTCPDFHSSYLPFDSHNEKDDSHAIRMGNPKNQYTPKIHDDSQ